MCPVENLRVFPLLGINQSGVGPVGGGNEGLFLASLGRVPLPLFMPMSDVTGFTVFVHA